MLLAPHVLGEKLVAMEKTQKGMMRQHQFYKVEFASFVEPQKCKEELERMLNCAEEVLKLLELPYQIVFYYQETWGLVQKKLMI